MWVRNAESNPPENGASVADKPAAFFRKSALVCG